MNAKFLLTIAPLSLIASTVRAQDASFAADNLKYSRDLF